ncbi:hypothetical protein CBS101457_004199 [Exobasidium rhododendri]|nr:hypothetical protein CBS101457_004199 [Exobasidium rhododendri]
MAASGSTSIARNHHPYRLEVQEITPVSVSILWSLRPPPLSAIPRNFFRQQKQQASAPHHQATLSNGSSTSSSSQLAKTPLIRAANEQGGTSTKNANRKANKITLRNTSPSKRGRLAKQSQMAPNQGAESEDWPSDDGATAVDEDEVREDDYVDHERTLDNEGARMHQDDYSEASDDGAVSAKFFDSGISVCVNGVPWSQVVMGDRGTDEAFVVVYGLLPSRDYELLFSVEGKQQQSQTLALYTKPAEKEEIIPSSTTSPIVVVEQPPRNVPVTATGVQASNSLRTHTPPMQDTDANPLELPSEQGITSLNAAGVSGGSATVPSTSNIQASLRRARKDASRAESALRSEIEAIKRGLERMSDVDHRSKQKVLALQESIRQATLHTKEIDEEAILIESEREMWKGRERERAAEAGEIQKRVEERLREGDAKIKKDNDEIELVERELQSVTKVLEEKRSRRDRLQKEKMAEVELELQRIEVEIESLLQPSTVQPSDYYHNYGNVPLQGQPNASFIPAPLFNRGSKARGGGGVRGGNRAASNPIPSGPHRRNNQTRQRGQGQPVHSSTSDDMVYDLQGSASSSTHGSVLNPNNPEFVPAYSSPNITKPTSLSIADQSPSANSRFAFSSTPFYNHVDFDAESRSSLGHASLSPRVNTLAVNSAMSTNSPWSSNAPNATSTWSSAIASSSPTLNHDVWKSSNAVSSSLAKTNNNTTSAAPFAFHSSSSPLHNKTSVPFGLDVSSLRGGTSPAFAVGNRAMEDKAPSSFPRSSIDGEITTDRLEGNSNNAMQPSMTFASLDSPRPED